MKKRIIVEIFFNAFGFTPDRFEKSWIDHRMSLFMNLTAKSLQKQTNQDFITIVRYEDSTEELIMDAISKYGKLPDNILFVNKKQHVNEIRKGCQDVDFLYLVRLDSDDLYHKTYIQQLHEYQHKEGTEVLINQKGYLYDSLSTRIADYYHLSPQFYVYIYKSSDYLAGKRYRPGGHGNIIKAFKNEVLTNRNYVNVLHNQNVSNKLLGTKNGSNEWISINQIITDKEKVKKILEEFM